MLSFPKALLISLSSLTLFVCACSVFSPAQMARSEQVEIMPPLLRTIEPPKPDATSADLEERADQLRGDKLYLDALDYYTAALAKATSPAHLLNKMGITELLMQRYKEARKTFEKSIKADHQFADAHNNLGVVFYEMKKFGASVKEYQKAIKIDSESASFFSNMGAAEFSRKDFVPAMAAYQHALELDPEVFVRSSRAGVQAQLPSPEDRAHYDYTVAKLYAKMGFSDRSLEYLKKAQEEGYKDLNHAYKDVEFSELRKDKRFTELMATKAPTLPD